MSKQEIQKMFEEAVHIGHRTHKWNPRMRKFICGERNGVHIINLEKTFDMLQKSMLFLAKTVAEGKNVLFVSTKPQSVKILEDTARACNMPYVTSKWIPGLITNFSTVKTRIRYLADLKQQEESGEMAKYTKKEASKLKKVIDKLQASLGGVQNLKAVPDVVFVFDVVRDKIVVTEARKLKIPVIAIVDTNADPNLVDYPIPGNDDSLKSLGYFMGKVKEVLAGERKK